MQGLRKRSARYIQVPVVHTGHHVKFETFRWRCALTRFVFDWESIHQLSWVRHLDWGPWGLKPGQKLSFLGFRFSLLELPRRRQYCQLESHFHPEIATCNCLSGVSI